MSENKQNEPQGMPSDLPGCVKDFACGCSPETADQNACEGEVKAGEQEIFPQSADVSFPPEACLPQKDEKKSWRRFYFWSIVGVLASYLFLPLFALDLVSFLYELVTSGMKLSENAEDLICQFSSGILTFLCIVLAVRLNFPERKLADFLLLRKQNVFSKKAILGLFIITLVGMVFTGWLTQCAADYWEWNLVEQDIVLEMKNGPWWKILLIGIHCIVIAPFLEEIAFRFILFRCFGQVLPVWAACTLTSFLFGGVHFNLQAFLSLTLLAFVLQYVTIKSKSLLPAMYLHAANNTFSVLICLLQCSCQE